MPERRLNPHWSQWTVQALSRLLATYAVIQGVAIVVGGPARWQGPSFASALTIPGAPESWGFVLIALGVAALAGTLLPNRRLAWVALAGIGAWAAFFAWTFVITWLKVPAAATTGIFTYGHQAVAACVLAVAYRKSSQ